MSNLLFSVTRKDCKFDYFRGSGKGGQKRNKTSSGVRCIHLASGAVGVSDDTRSQHQNKRIAFERMSNSKRFKDWHKIEVARRLGILNQIENKVHRMIKQQIKVEVFKEGKWKEWT